MSTILKALNAFAGMNKHAAALPNKNAVSLDERLIAAGVPPEALAEADAGHKRKGDTGYFELLIRKKAIDEIRLLSILSEHFSIPFLRELPMESIDIGFTQCVPIHYLKKHKMVPIITAEAQVIAVNDPVNFQPADDLRLLLQKQDLPMVLASQDAIMSAIHLAYDMSRSSAKDYFEEISETTADDLSGHRRCLVGFGHQVGPHDVTGHQADQGVGHLFLVEQHCVAGGDVTAEVFVDRLQVAGQVVVAREGTVQPCHPQLVVVVQVVGAGREADHVVEALLADPDDLLLAAHLAMAFAVTARPLAHGKAVGDDPVEVAWGDALCPFAFRHQRSLGMGWEAGAPPMVETSMMADDRAGNPTAVSTATVAATS